MKKEWLWSIKPRLMVMKWVEHVASIGNVINGNVTEFYLGRPKGRNSLEELGLEMMLVVLWVTEK
jgi:hypothetical protein